MANITWSNGASGNWGTGSAWTGGAAPGGADTVSINTGGTYTVTVAVAAAAWALTLGNATATLALNANLTLSNGLSDTQSTVNIAAGTLAVTGGNVTFGLPNIRNNDLYLGPTVNGPGTLSTGLAVTTAIGPGYVGYYDNYAAQVQLNLGGGVTWVNSGTIADSGIILIGNSVGATAGIVNASSGVFQFLAPNSAILNSTGASGTFANAGIILVNTSATMATALTNTGSISLNAGTLNLTTGSSIGGTVTGGGVIQLSSGNTTLTAVISGNLLLAGGALTLAGTSTITGSVSESSGALIVASSSPTVETIAGAFSATQGTVSIASGKTLALTSGSVNFGLPNIRNNDLYLGPTVNGPGTLSTGSAVTTAIGPGYIGYYDNYVPQSQLILGGGVTWSNSGTIADSGVIQIGNSSGASASIVNAASGVFQFLDPNSAILTNTGASSTFANAGIILVNTSATMATALTNTGSISLNAGTLNLTTGSSIGGTVTGGGVIQLSGGSSTLTAAISGNLLLAGGALTLAGTSTITGNVSETSGALVVASSSPTVETIAGAFSATQGTVSIASGKTLALTNASVNFGLPNIRNNDSYLGPTVNGPGTLSTGSAVTTAIGPGYVGYYDNYVPQSQLILGGGVTWANSGTVADSGVIQMGNSSGASASIVNAASGLFQFLAANCAIATNLGASGTFANAGTIEVDHDATMAAALTNTGTITLNAGTLNLTTGSVIGGTVSGGSGVLEFSGGSSKLTAAVSGDLLVAGGVLNLAPTGTVNASLTQTSGTVLVAKSTTLAGVVVQQGGLLQLSGTSLTGAAVTVSGGTLSGYGTVNSPLINTATVLAQHGQLSIANGASGSGVFAIAGASKLAFLGSASVGGVKFLAGGAETLLLNKASAVHTTLTGFGATDIIDLVKQVATSLSYANNMLTVIGASGTLAQLGIAGTYVQGNFSLQSDGASGTNIVYVASPASHLAASHPLAGHPSI